MSAQPHDSAEAEVAKPWSVTIGEHCIGSGMCVALDPEYFSLRDGQARTGGSEVAPDQRYIDAADTCPAGAISVTDSEGTEIAPT